MALVPTVSQSIWKFSPQTISGCVLWFDGADANTITTGSTFTWRDKSIYGSNATQSNAGNQPTYNSVTGALTFSNTNNTFLTTPYISTQSAETIFAVVTPSSTSVTSNGIYYYILGSVVTSGRQLSITNAKISVDKGITVGTPFSGCIFAARTMLRVPTNGSTITVGDYLLFSSTTATSGNIAISTSSSTTSSGQICLLSTIPSASVASSTFITIRQPLALTTATFLGYISGTTLTIPLTATIPVGSFLYGTGVTLNTYIVSGSGTSYVVSSSQTVGSVSSQVSMIANNAPSPRSNFTANSGTNATLVPYTTNVFAQSIVNTNGAINPSNGTIFLFGSAIVPGTTILSGSASSWTVSISQIIGAATGGITITTSTSVTFTGYISGSTLTLTLGHGQVITGVGITANTVISSGSGTAWVVSISQNVGTAGGPVPITTSNGMTCAGYISGTTLTLTTTPSATGLATTQTISGTNVLANTYIVSGTSPNWVISIPQTIVSTAVYTALQPITSASFTGSISGTTLTVSSNTGIASGQLLFGGVSANTLIGTFISGNTWNITPSQTVASTAMTTKVPLVQKNSFTAVIDGTTTLIVPGAAPGLSIGQVLVGTGVTSNTGIVSGSGTTFAVSPDQTVGSVSSTVSMTPLVGFTYTSTSSQNVTTLQSIIGATYNTTTTLGYLNGVNQAGSNTAQTFSGNNFSRISGTSTTTANGFDGTIYEIICYNNILSSYQRQQVEGYLAWKWNLQANLPAYHPYKSTLLAPLSRNFTIPDIVARCALWLDAADSSTITLSSSSVTTWKDKTGNNTPDATTAVGMITYNTTPINGIPTITFAASSYLQSTITYTTAFRNVFAVVNVGGSFAASVNYTIIHSLSGTVGVSVYSYAGDLEFNRTGGQLIANSATVSGSGFLSGSSIVSGTNSTGNVGIFVNGYSQAITTNTIGSFTAGSSAQLIGGYASSAQPTTIGELIVYDGILTSSQRQSVEGYLAKKWGLSLTKSGISVTGGAAGAVTTSLIVTGYYTVTITTATNTSLGLSVGTFINISGVTPNIYNGTWQLTAVAATSISFTIANGTTPGSITVAGSMIKPHYFGSYILSEATPFGPLAIAPSYWFDASNTSSVITNNNYIGNVIQSIVPVTPTNNLTATVTVSSISGIENGDSITISGTSVVNNGVTNSYDGTYTVSNVGTNTFTITSSSILSLYYPDMPPMTNTIGALNPFRGTNNTPPGWVYTNPSTITFTATPSITGNQTITVIGPLVANYFNAYMSFTLNVTKIAEWVATQPTAQIYLGGTSGQFRIGLNGTLYIYDQRNKGLSATLYLLATDTWANNDTFIIDCDALTTRYYKISSGVRKLIAVGGSLNMDAYINNTSLTIQIRTAFNTSVVTLSNLVYIWTDTPTTPTPNTTSLGGCITNSRADSTRSGRTITSWNDSSGNGYNITPTGLVSPPTITLNSKNGLPTVNFNSSNTLTMALGTYANNIGNDFSIFGVFYLIPNVILPYSLPITSIAISSNVATVTTSTATPNLTTFLAGSTLITIYTGIPNSTVNGIYTVATVATTTTFTIAITAANATLVVGNGLTSSALATTRSTYSQSICAKSGTNSAGNASLALSSQNMLNLTYTGNAVNGYSNTSNLTEGWYLVSIIANRTSTNVLNYIGLNGVSSMLAVISFLCDNSSTGVWTFGSGFTGKIGEIMFYPSTTTNQRQQIEGYLAKKWGILLPVTHPYYSLVP